MKRNRLALAVVLLTAWCVAWSASAYEKKKSAATMAGAARNFLAALMPEQKARTIFKFEDEQRFVWHFIPDSMFPRKGLSFKEMDSTQHKLAHAFLSTGLSQRGYLKATTIMSLETILKELEQGKGPVRDNDLYFFSVFGEPSETQTWGWKVEGHHLSLNFTVVSGQWVATAPRFFGSNPGEVKSGSRQGLRVLGQEEGVARDLVRSLTPAQLKAALIDETAPKDIVSGNSRKVDPGKPAGLVAGKMTKDQSEKLANLVDEYAHSLPDELAGEELGRLRQAGFDKIYFAWAGSRNPGEPHYYRLQGPTFLVEYDNTQNNANHIHAVWRGFDRDFGVDLLKMHYEKEHRPGSSHSTGQ
ncbi:MAG: DUF3500 domain-containing protein [Acidimicrobiia bacterium]|nr:DUF3500 domain-containing protein [Acidimicrobiia bacterium]